MLFTDCGNVKRVAVNGVNAVESNSDDFLALSNPGKHADVYES